MAAPTHTPLRRFVADGLRATIDSYAAGELPLHRFVWELNSRLATLAELTGLPEWRTLSALQVARQTIAAIDLELRVTGRECPTAAEAYSIAMAVSALRTAIARLDPTDPTDPIGPARPRPVLTLLARTDTRQLVA